MTVLGDFFVINYGPINHLKPATRKVIKEIRTQLVKDGWVSEKAEVLVMPDYVYNETYPRLDDLDFFYGDDNDEIDRDDDTLEAWFESCLIDVSAVVWTIQQLGDKTLQAIKDDNSAESPFQE